MTTWDELLDEFRALGGTADNIRLGHGEFGRGLFPVDPIKPVTIHVPDNLLVAVQDMILTAGALHVDPNAKTGERERAWLNRYQDEFAWGGGAADEVRQVFESVGALPAELRHTLLTDYGCGPWFREPSDQLIVERFFQTRTIRHRERPVVMPLIEMANHGDGAQYEIDQGVALRGNFSGEVLVEYSPLDSYDYFRNWGFATRRPVAFSLALTGRIDSASLKIDERFIGNVSPDQSWIPTIEKNSGNVTLPFLMLGHQRFPRRCKGIFYRLMRDAGYSGFVESFDRIRLANRLHFLDLLLAVEGIDVPIGRTLRTVANHQLRAMSFCYGVREI